CSSWWRSPDRSWCCGGFAVVLLWFLPLLLPRFARSGFTRRGELFFPHDRLHPRHVLAQPANFFEALRLPHLELELQPEELVVEIALLLPELGIGQISDFFCIHKISLFSMTAKLPI